MKTMQTWGIFFDQQLSQCRRATQQDGRAVIGCYMDLRAEYDALRTGLALVHRPTRVLLEVTGKDRAGWLHNLTTNEVKKLVPGEGNYAFALNTQGRILFDLNLMVRDDRIWIELERSVLDFAKTHLEKYIITEEVAIADAGDALVHFELAGEAVKAQLARLGVGHAAVMPRYSTLMVGIDGVEMPLVRTDFCGVFSVEMLVPVEQAESFWNHWTEQGSDRATPVGLVAVNIHRVEAGIPWMPFDLGDDCLPSETGQFERAVSYQKGCYLGQEIVERMRSRKSIARSLVGLRLDGEDIPPRDAQLISAEGVVVGRVTSACQSFALGSTIALGYAKTAFTEPGTRLCTRWEDHEAATTVCAPAFL